jgi:DNA-binding transcriptional LysR family regulator
LEQPDRASLGGRSWRGFTLARECPTSRVAVQQNSPPRLRMDSRYAQHRAALSGLGIVEHLRMIAEPDIAAGRLVQVLPEVRPPTVPVHAVFPSHRFLTPKVWAFVEYARAHFPETQTSQSTNLVNARTS